MGIWVYPDAWDEESDAGVLVPDYKVECYRQPSSLAEVERYLKQVFSSIRKGSFIVLGAQANEAQQGDSRQKNRDFINRFGLWAKEDQKNLLLSIDASEFCHIKRTEDGRDLYVFCLKRTLYKSFKGDTAVSIYVKHDYSSGENRDVIISFHELELPIYLPYAE